MLSLQKPETLALHKAPSYFGSRRSLLTLPAAFLRSPTPDRDASLKSAGCNNFPRAHNLLVFRMRLFFFFYLTQFMWNSFTQQVWESRKSRALVQFNVFLWHFTCKKQNKTTIKSIFHSLGGGYFFLLCCGWIIHTKAVKTTNTNAT